MNWPRVLSRVHEITSRVAVNQSQRALLAHTIDLQSGRLSNRESHISFRLPLTVHAAITGDEDAALDLAAASVLFYMGTDLLDDLADGDIAAEWSAEPQSQVLMLAIGMFATLPQLALAQIDAPPSVTVELQRALLRTSVRMAAGQRYDIGSRDGTSADVALESAWECIEAKSGAAIALLGEWPAILAGQPEAAKFYADFGSALGSAFCLLKDCRNLMDGAESTDLINGTRSYPLVLHLSGLRGENSRVEFSELLREARSDRARRIDVRDRMLSAGTFQMTWFVVNSCRQRALKALEQARPLEPAGEQLRAFLNFTSLEKA